ncbi:hypothetical protein [Thomasclavelia cocleata]|jgi:hypothetical protein|uniref:hypothetical protein n=1 Tax=Thomasclavelia cocleata TaxID=69824 RepID=UPI00256F4DCE|nr:hypothetical protein [Thomasclavelia cocleata]
MDLGSLAVEIVRFFVNEEVNEFVITYKNKRIEKTKLGYEIKNYPLAPKECNYIEILLGDILERIFSNDKEGTWLDNWDDFEIRFEKLLNKCGFKYFQSDPFTITIEKNK